MPEPSDSNAETGSIRRFPLQINRTIAAYLLMGLFVLCSSVGAALIFLPAGLITLGVTSGIYAYLLGSD